MCPQDSSPILQTGSMGLQYVAMTPTDLRVLGMTDSGVRDFQTFPRSISIVRISASLRQIPSLPKPVGEGLFDLINVHHLYYVGVFSFTVIKDSLDAWVLDAVIDKEG